MKKMMLVVITLLGFTSAVIPLSANAAEYRFGMWTYYTQYVGKVGWETHRQCIYQRTVWKQGYGALPNEMTSIFVINTGCPSASGAGLNG